MSFKHTLIFALFALFLGAQATELENCAILSVDNTAFFNMCPYARRDPITPNSTLNTGLNVTFTLGTGHTPSCDGKSQVWGTVNLNPLIVPNCYDVALNSPTISLVDPDDSDSGLVSTFSDNSDAGGYSLVVTMFCDANGDPSATTNFTLVSVVGNVLNVTATSYYGCPYATLSQIVNFLNDYKYPFVGVAVVVGLFLILFGFRLFSYAVFIITFIATTLFAALLFFEFVKFGSQQWILWVIFGACLLVGAVMGYLTVRYERFGFFCLGAALGCVLGLFVFNAALIYVLQGKTALFYVVVGVLGLIGGGLGVWLWKDMIIVGTSLIGSYLSVRAVSVLIGGFPNELAVAKGVTNLNAVAYAYLAVIVIIAIGGIYYQYREKRRLQEEADDEAVSAFYNTGKPKYDELLPKGKGNKKKVVSDYP